MVNLIQENYLDEFLASINISSDETMFFNDIKKYINSEFTAITFDNDRILFL